MSISRKKYIYYQYFNNNMKTINEIKNDTKKIDLIAKKEYVKKNKQHNNKNNKKTIKR